MQRKIGYGLIGASLTILLLLGIGFVWQAVVPATATETEPTVSNSSPDISPAIISNEPAEQNEQLLVSEPVTPTPIPTLSQTESLVLIEPEATPFILPQETDDATIILASLQYLADREQANVLATTGEWYLLETAMWWPQSPVIMNSLAGVQVESEKIIADDSTQSIFLLFDDKGQAQEALSVYRDTATNEIQQFAFLEDNSWVNVTLRDLGFADGEYIIPVKNNDLGQFPIQDVLEQLVTSYQQAPEQTHMWAYQQDGQFVVHQTFTYDQPQQFVQASDLVLSAEKIIWFDVETGQLVMEQAFSHLQNGLVEMNYRYTLLKQQSTVMLPLDVQALYEANLGDKTSP